MTISNVGTGSPPAATNLSPTAVINDLIHVLRQARQAQRESESAQADTAVDAARARADHAAQRATANRNHARLQFCMTGGAALAAAGKAVAGGFAERSGSEDSRASRVARTLDRTAEALDSSTSAAVAADDAFGQGREAGRLDAAMEQDSARQTMAQANQDRARLTREALDEALADARQAYRDLSSGEQ